MNNQDITTTEVNQVNKSERSNQMNEQSKSLFSRTSTKILLAVVIAAGLLAVLSGVVFNLDREITVQSQPGSSPFRQEFAALPEYGYIMAHSRVSAQSQAAILPAGLRNLAEFGYIQAHNQASTFTSNLSVAYDFRKAYAPCPSSSISKRTANQAARLSHPDCPTGCRLSQRRVTSRCIRMTNQTGRCARGQKRKPS